MKNFFKNVLANIVAFIVIIATLTILMLGFILVSAFFSDSKVAVKNNSVLTLDFETNIIDSPTENQGNFFSFSSKTKDVLLYDVIASIEKAGKDDNIKGISIETDNINAGITQLDAIRRALEDFKKTGKFVYTYGNVVSQPSYFLGTVADRYFLNPAGGIELKGLSTEVVFLKDFTEKYGIGTEVIRHGKFKSAVEPFLRDDLSDENREQLSTMLGDIWNNISTKMAISRKMDLAQFNTVVDSLYGIIPQLSLKHKLADKLVQKSEYDDLLKQKLKIDRADDLNKISLTSYAKSEKSKSDGGKVAVLYASGSILNGKGYEDIHAKNYIQQIKKLTDDMDVKAVVLRINSPGGSANASDEILFELKKLQKRKPLIVSFGDYAASGGYYIAMAADKIYSEPNTLTGSIGVFGVIPYFKELANRNGIRADVVKTNANANMFSAINGVSPGALEILTKNVEQTYKRFVYFVTENRKKTFEQIDEIGGGRIWSGTRAKQIGLVDELGGLQDAIKFAAAKAKLKDYKTVSYPKSKSTFELIFDDLDEDVISSKLIKSKIGEENFRLFEALTHPAVESPLLMTSPYKLNID